MKTIVIDAHSIYSFNTFLSSWLSNRCSLVSFIDAAVKIIINLTALESLLEHKEKNGLIGHWYDTQCGCIIMVVYKWFVRLFICLFLVCSEHNSLSQWWKWTHSTMYLTNENQYENVTLMMAIDYIGEFTRHQIWVVASHLFNFESHTYSNYVFENVKCWNSQLRWVALNAKRWTHQ